jgi:hypothetical protein
VDGFQVDVNGLRNAASAAASAGEQARQVHLGDGATEVAGALPGSRSMERAGPLATAWEQRLGTWGNDVNALSADLTASADRYASDENAAREDFSLFGWMFR